MREKLFSLTKKDFDVEWYRPGGKGGQHRDKTSNACRISHAASGASAQCQDFREASRNKALAFVRLTETDKFKRWMRIKKAGALGLLELIEEEVEKGMQISNLKFEGKDDKGLWTKLEG